LLGIRAQSRWAAFNSDVGRRDDHRQQQARCVHDEMALAAPDLLAAVGADLLPGRGGLDRPAVVAAWFDADRDNPLRRTELSPIAHGFE